MPKKKKQTKNQVALENAVKNLKRRIRRQQKHCYVDVEGVLEKAGVNIKRTRIRAKDIERINAIRAKDIRQQTPKQKRELTPEQKAIRNLKARIRSLEKLGYTVERGLIYEEVGYIDGNIENIDIQKANEFKREELLNYAWKDYFDSDDIERLKQQYEPQEPEDRTLDWDIDIDTLREMQDYQYALMLEDLIRKLQEWKYGDSEPAKKFLNFLLKTQTNAEKIRMGMAVQRNIYDMDINIFEKIRYDEMVGTDYTGSYIMDIREDLGF